MRARAGWLVAATVALAGCPRPPAQAPGATRIASVTIDSDAILWALGPVVREQVVAVSSLVDDPRYSPLVGTWPSTIPRVSGDSESLVALRPSVVFVAEWSDPSGRALLEQASAHVVVLSGFGGFEDYRARVRTIAAATDAKPQGETLVADFDQALRAATSHVGAGKTIVSYASGSVAGAGTTFDDEARAAGFENLATRDGMKGHMEVGLEQVVAWQPDAIVIPCEADCDATEADFAAKPGVATTPAARHGHIVALPGPILFATGPRMLEVTKALVRRFAEAPP